MAEYITSPFTEREKAIIEIYQKAFVEIMRCLIETRLSIRATITTADEKVDFLELVEVPELDTPAEA